MVASPSEASDMVAFTLQSRAEILTCTFITIEIVYLNLYEKLRACFGKCRCKRSENEADGGTTFRKTKEKIENGRLKEENPMWKAGKGGREGSEVSAGELPLPVRGEAAL